MSRAQETSESYKADADRDLVRDDGGVRDTAMELYCKAGQSKRVWGELYKVQTALLLHVTLKY